MLLQYPYVSPVEFQFLRAEQSTDIVVRDKFSHDLQKFHTSGHAIIYHEK